MTQEQLNVLLAHEGGTLAHWLQALQEAERKVDEWQSRVEATRMLIDAKNYKQATHPKP